VCINYGCEPLESLLGVDSLFQIGFSRSPERASTVELTEELFGLLQLRGSLQ